jgi:ABC-type transporter Mla subunit MlaD
MDTTAGTLDTIHTSLTGSLTDSIVSIKDVLPGIKDGARAIDTALTDLSKLPIGPDYKPAVLFADSIQGLSDAVGALPADIDTLATKVDELQGSTTALNLDLTQLSTTVSKMHDNIAAVQDALDKYVPAAADARLVASRARSNLDNDTALARLLIIAIALALVLSEVVLLWIARHLTNGTVRSEPISNEAAGAPGPRPPSHPEA